VLRKLKENRLYSKLYKYEFETEKTTFLGHIINSKGLLMKQDKVNTIIELSIPNHVTKVQSFIWLCNYYRKFIKNFKIVKPLYNFSRKDIKFAWIEDCENTYKTLKLNFKKKLLLSHVDPELLYIFESYFLKGTLIWINYVLFPSILEELINLKEITLFTIRNYFR